MPTPDDNDPFHGFVPALRTLNFRTENLRFVTGWQAVSMLEPEQATPQETLVFERFDGVAQLDVDCLVDMRDKGRRTQTVNLTLRPYEDSGTLARDWERICSLRDLKGLRRGNGKHGDSDVDDEVPPGPERLMRHCYEEFQQRPPTAWVGLSGPDWEVGQKADSWDLECKIPAAVFRRLVVDHRAGRHLDVEFAVWLSPTLTDSQYAPPAFPVNVGLPCFDGSDSPDAHGWVRWVSWKASEGASEANANQKVQATEVYSSEDAGARDSQAEPLHAVATSVALLARRVDRGFWLLVGAMLLVATLS